MMKGRLKRFLQRVADYPIFNFTTIKLKLIIAIISILTAMTLLNILFSSFLIGKQHRESAYRNLNFQIKVFNDELMDVRRELVFTGINTANDAEGLTTFSRLFSSLKMGERSSIEQQINSLDRLKMLIRSSDLSGAAVYFEGRLSHYINSEEAGLYNFPALSKRLLIYTKRQSDGSYNLAEWHSWLNKYEPSYFATELTIPQRREERIFLTERGLFFEVTIPVKGNVEARGDRVEVKGLEAIQSILEGLQFREGDEIIGAYVFYKKIDPTFLVEVAKKTGMRPAIYFTDQRAERGKYYSLVIDDRETDPMLEPGTLEILLEELDYRDSLSEVVKKGNRDIYHLLRLWQPGLNNTFIISASLSNEQTLKNIRQAILLLVVIALSIFIIVFVAGFLLVDRQIKPLFYLTNVARRLKDDDLDIDLSMVADDEFGILSRTLTGLIERVKEHERIRQEMEMAERLHAVHMEKNLFFLSFAHDVRTPLTIITNYFNRYLEQAQPDPDLEVVKENLDKLLYDIVNILDSEKLERGKPFYDHSRSLNLSTFMESKVAFFAERVKGSELTLKSEIKPELYIRADLTAIDRIVNNLLDNAVKYNRPGGNILLKLCSRGDNITLIVKDSGIGMSREQIDSLFAPFAQGSRKNFIFNGLGLGLYIVKNIITSLGGSINVESEPEQGSTIEVVLKGCPAGECGESEPASTPVKGGSRPLFKGPGRIEVKNIVEGRPNLLVVDDDINILRLLQERLGTGYNIYPAASGEEAVRRLEGLLKPDLIISDMKMNEVSGSDLLRTVASRKDLLGTPFIFVTADSSIARKVESLELGAIDYIIKPFNMEELEAKVSSILRNRERFREANLEQIEKSMFGLLENLKQKSSPPSENEAKKDRLDSICNAHKLTKREREILGYLMDDTLLLKEIGYQLNISLRTVENHSWRIYRKFGVQNRQELLESLKRFR